MPEGWWLVTTALASMGLVFAYATKYPKQYLKLHNTVGWCFAVVWAFLFGWNAALAAIAWQPDGPWLPSPLATLVALAVTYGGLHVIAAIAANATD